MISSETSYKLAEIIRDTYPNLYRKGNDKKLQKKQLNINIIKQSISH